MANNALYFIRDSIYALKHEYGFPIDIYHLDSSIANRETGKKTIIKSKYKIPKAIMLIKQTLRKAFLSYLQLHKFKYGDYLDTCDAVAVIENKDLPLNFTVENDDYVVYLHEKYDIKDSGTEDINQITILGLIKVTGAEHDEILESTVKQKLIINQLATYTF